MPLQALLGKTTRGGTIIIGALNLSGLIEPVLNAAHVAELGTGKQEQSLLISVFDRRT